MEIQQAIEILKYDLLGLSDDLEDLLSNGRRCWPDSVEELTEKQKEFLDWRVRNLDRIIESISALQHQCECKCGAEKRGKWEILGVFIDNAEIKCSACNSVSTTSYQSKNKKIVPILYPYCKWCGADMRQEESQ